MKTVMNNVDMGYGVSLSHNIGLFGIFLNRVFSIQNLKDEIVILGCQRLKFSIHDFYFEFSLFLN